MAFTPINIGTQRVAPEVSFAPTAPPAEKSFYDKTLDFAQKLPTAPLGNAIGNSVRAIGALAKGDTATASRLNAENNANFGKVVGSTAYSALAPASFAVGGAATVLGTAAKFGTVGALSTGSASLAKGNDAGQIAKDAAIGGTVGAVTGGVTKLLGNFLQKTGDKITTSVIKPSKADIEDGFSIDTIKKFNLGGSLKQSVEKTDKVMDDLSRQLNEKLAASNSSINLSTTFEQTAKKLLGNKLESFGSNASMERALEALRSEVVTSAGENGLVSIPQAQTVKRAAGHLGAWVFGQSDPDSTARQKVYTTFYRLLKEQIEQGSPEGVREINKQLSDLIPVMNALIRRVPVAERNNVLSLSDIITLTGASLEPRTLALTLANFASKSGTVGSLLSKAGAGTTGAVAAPTATNLTASLLPQSPKSQPKSQSTTSSQYTPEQEAAIRKGAELGMKVSPVGGTAKAVASFFRKQPPYGLLKDMARFIDYVRIKKPPTEYKNATGFEADIRDAIGKFGLNPNQSNAKLVNQFEEILDKAKFR